MNSILQIFYSVFSGVTLSLGIPNEFLQFGSPVLAFIAISLYYIAIKNSKSYRQAFFNGAFQTFSTHICSSFWLANFKDFALLTLGGTAFGTFFLGGFFGLYFYLPNASFKDTRLSRLKLSKNISETAVFRIFYFTTVYVIYEWCKSTGFLGYPWGTIPDAMYKWPIFMQIADITGTYGITFITVLLNCILVETVNHLYDLPYIPKIQLKLKHMQEVRSSWLIFASLAILAFLYGNIQYYKERTPIKTITSIIVQQNGDPWAYGVDTDNILMSEKLTTEAKEKLLAEGKEPQMVVWSEGTLVTPFPMGKFQYKSQPSDNPLIPFIKDLQVPFITGGSYAELTEYKDNDFYRYYNAALVFDKEGAFRGHYSKLHLVPFAEALPGSEIPAVRELLMKLVGISSGWSKGENLPLFEIPCTWVDGPKKPFINTLNLALPENIYEEKLKNKAFAKISTPICFDDSFTDVIRPMFNNGAELFVNITDDSWSRKKSSEYQHFVVASYRSIEYRTTMIRSTNGGYTVVLDPSGKVIADLPLFEPGAISYDVPIYDHCPTIYSKLGNWLPYALVWIFIVYVIISRLNFKKSDYIPSERKLKNPRPKKITASEEF